jgi:methyl-accepting chemotaxis protein
MKKFRDRPLREKIHLAFAAIALVFVGFTAVAIFVEQIGIIIGAGAAALVFVALMMDVLLRSVANPAKQLAQSAKSLANGDFRNMAVYESEDELGQLSACLADGAETLIKLQEARQAIAGYEKDLENMAAHLENLLYGELSTPRIGYGQKSRHVAAIFVLSRTLGEIMADMQSLAASAASGNFSKRLDAGKYGGSWQDLAHSMNGLMEALAPPIEQVRAALDAIAAGKLDVKVTADAKGELLKLKVSSNNAAASLAKYVKAITHALENIDKKSRFLLDLPHDFAPIKASITKLGDINAGAAPGRPHPNAPASERRQATSFVNRPRRNAIDEPKKFSGAPKSDGLEAGSGATPGYMRPDFGKY